MDDEVAAPEKRSGETSFARGLRLLMAVADHGSVRAEVLAQIVDMPVSSVYRYLRTLHSFGLVERRDSSFRPAPLLRLPPVSKVRIETLVQIADPVLQALVESTGETAILLIRVGLSALCLHKVESRNRIRMTFDRGEILPLHAGAGSRVLLAYAPPEVLRDVIERGLTVFTPNTPDRTVLRRKLAQVRTKGVTMSKEELIPGALAIAAPVFVDGSVVAALDVAGPRARCDTTWQARTKELLPRVAGALGRTLEARAPLLDEGLSNFFRSM